ncbi:MAG: hypothetical protein V4498_01830 [candidate division FCPU426 bacterium]
MTLKSSLATWRLRLALSFGLFDALWAADALRLSASTQDASTVRMINVVVWIFLNLPAALLASIPFGGMTSENAPVPSTQLILMGALGAIQFFLMGWLLGRWMDKLAKRDV